MKLQATLKKIALFFVIRLCVRSDFSQGQFLFQVLNFTFGIYCFDVGV